MLTSETKKHIDSARQVLVGVVPNPASQIDQITNALIYKFMDDMDQMAIKAGGKPSFFIGDLERYAWTRIMDPRLGNQERMNLYSEALVKFSEAKQLPELFRNIFKSAYLPYRSPEVLGLFLKEISFFDYKHSEELGNAYEYLLSIMSSQGDAGQFRTPRHIIDFIVDVVNPTKRDKVLDPACGTAGFLISAYKHILEQHDGKDDPDKKEKPLTPDERKKLVENFEGYDIDPTMVRIAQVNMYLHQFKNPKIFQYDSLSGDERWNDKFDVILANPPFMSPKGGIRPHSKFSVQSSRSEVLFVDYIMNHLRPTGRAGIIVPEGIIFQSGKAHKQLRKNLVEDGLYAVVSLPSGVFNPYAGVKTSILLFNNELAKKRKEILFVKIGQDGFDLGANKRPIDKNDLPVALDILNKWNEGKKVKNNLAVYVEKIKIAESGEYNLTGDRYRAITEHVNTKCESFKLKELEDSGLITLGRGQVISKKDLESNPGIYPVYSSSAQGNGEFGQYGSYMFDEELITWSVDGGGRFFYRPKHKFSVTNVSGWLRVNDTSKINPKYLFKILDTEWLTKTFDYVAKAHPSVIREMYQIPIPPLEIQEQVVQEIDGYSDIVSGARQIIDRWRPKLDIDPDWKIENLAEVCEQITDGTHQTPKYISEGIPFLRVTDITESNDSKKYISKEEHKELIKRCQPKKGDVLYTKNGTIGVAKMIDWDFEFSIFVSLALLKPKKEILYGKYLEHFLNSAYALMQAKAHSKSGTITNLHLVEIRQFKIPVPSLDIQKEIVDKIEEEHKIVEGNRVLIDVYDKKIKDVIAGLWGE